MKKLFLSLVILIVVTTPLQAIHRQKKVFINDKNLFIYKHGMYLAYPGKLFKFKSLRYSKSQGYYTYKKNLRKIPLSRLYHYPWTEHQETINEG